MLDALLFAVRDTIRQSPYFYDYATCDIMDDGKPPPRCGDVFVAIHPGAIRSKARNCLDEMYAFSLTLTMRITMAPDRVGEQLLATKKVRNRLARNLGFNARVDQLRALTHVAWDVLSVANTYLVQLAGDDVSEVYGFCEVFAFKGADRPTLCHGDWFTGDPSAPDTGLKAELRFDDCRRFQPLGQFM